MYRWVIGMDCYNDSYDVYLNADTFDEAVAAAEACNEGDAFRVMCPELGIDVLI